MCVPQWHQRIEFVTKKWTKEKHIYILCKHLLTKPFLPIKKNLATPVMHFFFEITKFRLPNQYITIITSKRLTTLERNEIKIKIKQTYCDKLRSQREKENRTFFVPFRPLPAPRRKESRDFLSPANGNGGRSVGGSFVSVVACQTTICSYRLQQGCIYRLQHACIYLPARWFIWGFFLVLPYFF